MCRFNWWTLQSALWSNLHAEKETKTLAVRLLNFCQLVPTGRSGENRTKFCIWQILNRPPLSVNLWTFWWKPRHSVTHGCKVMVHETVSVYFLEHPVYIEKCKHWSTETHAKNIGDALYLFIFICNSPMVLVKTIKTYLQ